MCPGNTGAHEANMLSKLKRGTKADKNLVSFETFVGEEPRSFYFQDKVLGEKHFGTDRREPARRQPFLRVDHGAALKLLDHDGV